MQKDDDARRSALLSAMTTEHFVLQTAISVTNAELASRASVYVFALSSALVAMGFAMDAPQAFMPFVGTVLPAVFLLGVFTIQRMVDIAAENQQAHIGIARIRAYYRTLHPDAEVYFSAKRGRWPDGDREPSLWAGAIIGYLTTGASMIAFINAIVAGAGVTLLTHYTLGAGIVVALLAGAIGAAIPLVLFYLYQRYRINELVDEWEADSEGA